MFKGAITALVTPFCDGNVDESSYQSFIEWQIEQKIHGLVTCGTTGESPTLDHQTHNRVVSMCVEAAAGKVPVIAGAGSNCTAESVALAKHAKKVKADAILVATPYYNKPNQEGIYQHFKAICESVDIPIFIYNIPGRSVVDITDETIGRIAKLPNVVGLKDATGDLSRVTSVRKYVDNDFILLSGEDGTAVAFNAQGGVGVISVTSNVAPALVSQCQEAHQQGNDALALALHEKLMPLHAAMFCDSSPAPAKYALSLLGKVKNELRLPLIPLLPEKQPIVHRAMQQCGIID